MTLNGEAWGVSDAAALVAEIERDLAEREASYPELVSKGRMDKLEANYRVSLIRDIRDDLMFAFRPLAAGEILETWERGDWRVTWREKVRWIDRELGDRRARAPELIAKGRLSANDAQRRISTMEHLRRLYWNSLFQWQPPEGPALDYLKAQKAAARSGAPRAALLAIRQGEGARLYRELVRRHMAELEAEEDDRQGRLVA